MERWTKLAEDLTGALDGNARDRVPGVLSALTHLTVRTIMGLNTSNIADGAMVLSRLQTGLRLRLDAEKDGELQYTIGRIDGLVAILVVTEDWTRKTDFTTWIEDAELRPILDLLHQVQALETNTIAARLRRSEEVIDRQLTILQAAGMVMSQRCGKPLFHRLTLAAQQVMTHFL